MLRFVFAAFFLLAYATCGTAVAEELTSGRFSMSLPDGFTYVQGTTPAIYRGSSGERIRISVEAARRPRSVEDSRSEVRALVGQVSRQFREMENEFGRPLWPLRVNVVDTGDVHISSAMESNSRDKRGYVLNYAVVSPTGDFSLIMVAGDGDAFESFGKYKAPLASARWR